MLINRGCNEIYEDYTLEHIYRNFRAVTQRFWLLSSEIVWNMNAIYSVCCLDSAGCLLPFCPSRINVFFSCTSGNLIFFVHFIPHDVAFSFYFIAAATKEYKPNCMTLRSGGVRWSVLGIWRYVGDS